MRELVVQERVGLAARRNNMGRAVADCKAGARRAQSALCGAAGGDIATLRTASQHDALGDGQQTTTTWRDGGRPGNAALAAENRNNGL